MIFRNYFATSRQMHTVGENKQQNNWVQAHVGMTNFKSDQSSLPSSHVVSANHVPVQRTHRLPASSIARHLLESGHCVDLPTAFNVLYASKHSRVLQFCEAIAINKWKPELCKQKELFVTLQLPWR